MKLDEKRLLLLHAYCDGELSRFARWRMEQKLRSSPELRRELAELVELSKWIREVDAADTSSHRTLDSWSEIGPALSGIDREIESNRGGIRAGLSTGYRSSKAWVDWNWAPLAAAGAVAVLVLAVISLDGEDEMSKLGTPSLQTDIATQTASGSLRYLKTNGVSYLVARDSDNVTIIWLMDSDGAPEEGA